MVSNFTKHQRVMVYKRNHFVSRETAQFPKQPEHMHR